MPAYPTLRVFVLNHDHIQTSQITLLPSPSFIPNQRVIMVDKERFTPPLHEDRLVVVVEDYSAIPRLAYRQVVVLDAAASVAWLSN